MTALTAAALLLLASNPACSVHGLRVQEIQQLAAIARVESGGDPYALHDDTTNTAYHPGSLEESERIATALIARGHSVGVGLMQLTPPSSFGLSVKDALDPCKSMRAGSALHAQNLAIERAALCRYNTGRSECSNGYPELVQKAEARLAQSPAAVVVEPPIPERKPQVFDVLHGTFVQTGGAAGPVNLLDHRRIRHEADVHSEQGNNS